MAQIATVEIRGYGKISEIHVPWTSHTDGTVSIELGTFANKIIGFTTDPGSAAPTDDYDVVVNNPRGVDVLQGQGANRDTSTTETIMESEADGVTGAVHFLPLIGVCTLEITNAGSAKTGQFTLYIEG